VVAAGAVVLLSWAAPAVADTRPDHGRTADAGRVTARQVDSDRDRDRDHGRDSARDRDHGRGERDDHGRGEDRLRGRREVHVHYRTIHDQTFVPAIELFGQVGCRVSNGGGWVRIGYGDRTVFCRPGSLTVMIVEGSRHWTESWDEAPVYVDGQLYVPVRPCCSDLGLDMDVADGSVTIGLGFFFRL
jgi:hypothetical protein